MKEQTSGQSRVQAPDSSPQAQPAGAIIPGQQEQEYFTVASRGKNVRRSTILLVALFGLGLICLWVMIKKTAPAATQAAGAENPTRIEQAIARLTGVRSEIFSGMDEIVEKFYEFSDVKQVGVNELIKNPFQLELFLQTMKNTAPFEAAPSQTDLQMIRRQQMAQQAGGLRLLSIIQSDDGNCCMINDRILREQDSINNFKVTKISGQSVSLESDGMETVLRLSE